MMGAQFQEWLSHVDKLTQEQHLEALSVLLECPLGASVNLGVDEELRSQLISFLRASARRAPRGAQCDGWGAGARPPCTGGQPSPRPVNEPPPRLSNTSTATSDGSTSSRPPHSFRECASQQQGESRKSGNETNCPSQTCPCGRRCSTEWDPAGGSISDDTLLAGLALTTGSEGQKWERWSATVLAVLCVAFVVYLAESGNSWVAAILACVTDRIVRSVSPARRG